MPFDFKDFNFKDFNPFCHLIGLSFTKIKKGYSQCVVEVNKELYNPHKVLHGAILYTMADTGMGGALYTCLKKGELCATIEVKINYFKAVRTGTITCDTKVINKGRRTAVMESELINDGVKVAKALGTYSIFIAKIKTNE